MSYTVLHSRHNGTTRRMDGSNTLKMDPITLKPNSLARGQVQFGIMQGRRSYLHMPSESLGTA